MDSIDALAEQMDKEDDSLMGVYGAAYQELEAKQYAATADFIKSHPDYELSSFWLFFLQADIAEEKTKELYENLTDSVKNDKFAKAVLEHIQKSIKLETGLKAPEIILPDSSGQEIRLSAFQGKYVLIDFWASSCGPCRAENVNLVKIYQAYKDKGFEIVSVSVDTKELSWKKAMKKDQMNWISVWDLKGNYEKVYDISSYPTNFLIDPNGVIVAKYLRGSALPKKLDEIFKTSSAKNL